MAVKNPHVSQKSQKQTDTRNTTGKPTGSLRLPGWLPYVFFALSTAIYFFPQLFGDAYLWEDFAEYNYPARSYAAVQLAEGSIPHWTPYVFGGMPFLADIQIGFFYPPNLVLTLFVSDGRLPVKAHQWIIILHFFIAQVGMYLLCRHLGMKMFGAMFAAVAYGFSACLVLHAIHSIIVYHLALFPFIVWQFHAALSRLQLKNGIYAGLLLGLAMLSGHPQSTLYINFFLLLMALWYGVAALRAGELRGGGVARFVGIAFATVTIGAALFAVQLLPSQELAEHSQRNDFTYEEAGEGSIGFSQLLTLAVPKVFGQVLPEREYPGPWYKEFAPYYFYWETGFYAGLICLILAVIGIALKARSRLGGFLLFILAFALMFALGTNGFIFPVFYELPLFGSFRFPVRIMYYFVFGLAIFGGFALDSLLDPDKRRNIGWPLICIATGLPGLLCIGIATGVILTILATPATVEEAIRGFGATALFYTLLTAALIILARRGSIPPVAAGAALLLLLYVDLYSFGAGFNRGPVNPEQQYELSAEMRNTFSINPPDELFRVSMRRSGAMAMQRNQGFIDDIRLYEGYNPLNLAHRVPPAKTEDSRRDLLNIRYHLVADPQTNQAGFQERPGYFPNAYMRYRATVKAGDSAVKNYMATADIDYRNTVVLGKELQQALAQTDTEAVEHSVRCLSYTANEFSYRVESTQNGVLVLSEIWYPAWRAYLNGREVPVLRANYSFRAVEIPAGTHTVEMRFESAAFARGLWISLLGLALCGGALILLHIRKPKNATA